MIRSMTGFGRGETKFKNGKLSVEIRTVNHKFFDATLKIPLNMSIFEEKIKEAVQRKVKRGKINLNLAYDGMLSKNENLRLNIGAASDYYRQLLRLKRNLGVKENIGIRDIITLPGVLDYSAQEAGVVKLWPKIKEALEKALDNLLQDREKEGRSIYKDLEKRLEKIERMLSVIRSRAHINIEEYRKRFTERIKDLTGGRDIDMGRLEMEVAIFAKNSDISEEITRLENHLSNFNKTISQNGEAGKKIDFIAQELHREINTVGAKASDFKISKSVIEVKSEIEKIREQAKNIE